MDENEKLENLDEARNAAADVFSGEQEAFDDTEESPETEAPEEVPDEQLMQAAAPVDERQQMTENAIQTAEAAAQAAAQKDMQLQQIMSEMSALKEQNDTLQQTIQQMSQQQEEAIVGEAMGPPELDLANAIYEDPETLKARQAEYAQKMAEYVKGGLMKEIAPFLDQAKAGLAEKEKQETLQMLSQVPVLQGINDMLPQLDTLLANNAEVFAENAPIDAKYAIAYAMAKGIDSINHPPQEPTAEELMRYYENNPEFKDLIEKKRVEQVKGSQQVPPLSASSGAANAALNIKEKPKTLEEARSLTRELFGA